MVDTKSTPKPGERWLSRPPYLLIAHVIRVEKGAEPPVVSYELLDEEGFLLDSSSTPCSTTAGGGPSNR